MLILKKLKKQISSLNKLLKVIFLLIKERMRETDSETYLTT